MPYNTTPRALARALLVLASIAGSFVVADDNTHDALFDGSSVARLGLYDFVYNGKTLVGKGGIRSRAIVYNNYEVRVRLRYLNGYTPVAIGVNKSPVPEGTLSAEEKKSWKGKWRELHISFRQMNNEQIRIENLAPIAEGDEPLVRYLGGKLKLSNTIPLDKIRLNDRGYAVDAPGNKSFLLFEDEVEIARIAYRPLSPVSPRPYLNPAPAELAKMVSAGETLYKTTCIACHGDGIGKAPNPLARSFASEALQNGADLTRLATTIGSGFRNMPGMPNFSIRQRYELAHYLRENIFRPHNPKNLIDLDEKTLRELPYPLYWLDEQYARDQINTGDREKIRQGRYRDFGPAMISVNGPSRNALQVSLAGETTLSYDLNAMQTLGVWHGSFMAMTGSHYFTAKGGSAPKANGTMLPELRKWRWAHGGNMDYPVNNPSGPLRYDGLRWRGHYLHDERVVLSYTIDGVGILETPECVYDKKTGQRVLIQHLRIESGTRSLLLGIADAAGPNGPITDSTETAGSLKVAVRGDCRGLQWENHDGLAIRIPAGKTRQFTVIRAIEKGASAMLERVAQNLQPVDFDTLVQGGKGRWKKTDRVSGELSDDTTSSYVVDTIPVPFENEWNSWMRTTALAFFSDGRAAVTTYDGDVWIVSGIDRELKEVTWRRFAAGLHEAFGCEVVDGKLVVTTRNGLVRLHDHNNDGEADYYEQFFADPDFSLSYHGFNFDLVRDKAGYFYYSKSGQVNDNKLHASGGCYKITPDGSGYDMLGTGFRTPNGMGILPDGRVLMADNQGVRVPASKISILKADTYYGSGKSLKHDFEQPMLWMPQHVDNSSGGQLWLQDKRFGPYGKGSLLHTSCGSGKAMVVFIDDREKTTQAATSVFPFRFKSGVMRARVNPTDGQVYLTGTRGWGVTVDEDGCLQRIRYTGKKNILVIDARSVDGRLQVRFNGDMRVVDDSVEVSMWNYTYSNSYGSKNYSVLSGKEGVDTLEVTDIETGDGRLTVKVPGLRPAHQVKLSFRLQGEHKNRDLYLTLHAL